MVASLRFHPIFIESLLAQPKALHELSAPRLHDAHSSSWSSSAANDASTDTEYRVEMDLPGVKQEDVDVTVQEESGLISVAAIRKNSNKQGETIKKARLSRTFSVDSTTVDLSKLQANLADGVLVVTAPKKPKAAPRKVAVTAIAQGLTKNPAISNEKESDECNSEAKEKKEHE